MVKLSGGEALAKSLAREGVEVVFGIPGIQIYGGGAGLRDEPGIRMITTRHEQATTYMADGYARASGKPGVALVVPGAGLYNAAAGLTNAYSRSTPVLLIAGQIPRGAIGKNIGAVHEIADQPGTVRSVTKWQRQALRGCLKTDLSCSWREDCRASKVAFHEQAELSKRPERPTMAATRTTAASSQTGRPTNQVPASGGDERYSLCVAYRVRVADASSRPASLAHHIPLLSHLAARWDLGEDS